MALRLGLPVLLYSAILQLVHAACQGTDRLAVQVSWFSQPQFAGWEVPNNGVAGAPSYADECLRVQVRPGGPDFDGIEELVARRADLALVDAAYIAQAVESGVNLTVVGNYLQRSALLLFALDKNMKLADLEGKNVGVWCCGFNIPIEMMIQVAGLKTNVVPQSFTLNQVFDGSIDAGSVMIYNELAMALQTIDDRTNFLRQRADIVEFNPSDLGVPFPHNTVVMLTERMDELADIVVRTFRVVTRTWLFCRDNEMACVKSYPRANAHYVWQLREMLKLIFPSPGGIGVMDYSHWDDMVDFLKQEGIMQTKIHGKDVINNSLILESHKDPKFNPATVDEKTDFGSVAFCAPYGSDFFVTCDDSTHEHTFCPVGHTPVGPNDGDCAPCSAGTFAYNPDSQVTGSGVKKTCAPECGARMLLCNDCPAGQFQHQDGASSCQLCERGRFRNSTMAPTQCDTCPPGMAATESGGTVCSPCAPGQFKSNVSTVECDRCPRGRYMSEHGATECTSCPDGMDSLSLGSWSVNECTCPGGQYTALDGSCKQCPVGMTCAPGSSEDTLNLVSRGQPVDGAQHPMVEFGYWTSNEEPLKVFLCSSPDACPGGFPETCLENRVDTACAMCANGFYPKEGECIQCNDLELSGILYPWMPMLGPIPIVVLYRLSLDNVEVAWAKWTTTASCLLFLGMLHYQAVGLVMGTALEMPRLTVQTLSTWKVVVDIPGILHPECMGYNDFTKSIVLKTVMPIHVCLTFFATWAIAKVVHKIIGRFEMNPNIVFNVCMAIVQTFFVSIAFVALQIFMCYKHPHGAQSLRVAPQVLCGSDEWNGVVGVGIAAILVYVVGLLGTFMYILVIFPDRFQDLNFRTRWKFLVLRQRPGVWWWSFVVLIKGLSLSLAQVLFTQGVLQAYWTFLVLLFYCAGLFTCYPWLSPYANFCDGVATLSLLFFCAMASWFSEKEPGLQNSISIFIIINSFLPLLATFAAGLLLVIRSGPGALEQQAASRVAFASKLRDMVTILASLEDEGMGNFVAKLSQQDLTMLKTARAVIMAELLGQQPGSEAKQPMKFFKQRLVLKDMAQNFEECKRRHSSDAHKSTYMIEV